MRKRKKYFKTKSIIEFKDILIDKKYLKSFALKPEYFTRDRKFDIDDILLYEFNKKGLTSKMEIINFNDITKTEQVSSVAVFKQREKLASAIFKDMNNRMMRIFYHECKDEVKTYKGYVLLAIDGSDFEIPNTKITREEYNGKQQEQCARVTVSTCYDVNNKYTLDTIVEKYNYSETEMAIRHYETIKKENLLDDQKVIWIMDRGYMSLSNMYDIDKNGDKFLIRVSFAYYKSERANMKSNDEMIEIKPTSLRKNRAKESNMELYDHLKNGNSIKVRCVKIELKTGEIEYIFTNLTEEEFNTAKINELYNSRWGIEINYNHLKNNVQIECITSGKKNLIEQDIFSQIYVSNMLQSFINDAEEEIEQEKYKNKQKINRNMAIGLFKNSLIYIILEKNSSKRDKMADKLIEAMLKYLVSVEEGRNNPRKSNPKNKYNLNQRRSF